MVSRALSKAVPAVMCCALVGAALGGTAVAATPTKGATYVGELAGTQTRVSKRVLMKVSKSGRSATARLFCNGPSFGTLPRFKISRGRFSGVRKAGTLVLWRLSGRFASGDTARVKLSLPTTCDGKGGKLTLERKP